MVRRVEKSLMERGWWLLKVLLLVKLMASARLAIRRDVLLLSSWSEMWVLSLEMMILELLCIVRLVARE